MSLNKFKSSYEIFPIPTAGGIMPISKINGESIGCGCMGKLTKKIYKIFWEKHIDLGWNNSVEELIL